MVTLSAKRQRAFTMLEVVIAMAVGAIGIVAFAGLQIKSIEISEESHERATAAYIAAETVERMSMNTQDFAAQQIYRGNSWDDAPADVGALVIPELCADECDPPTRAALDIREVKRLARALLPNGDVNHYVCGTDDDFDCIVVAWEDADINDCGLDGDGAGLEDCFILQAKLW